MRCAGMRVISVSLNRILPRLAGVSPMIERDQGRLADAVAAQQGDDLPRLQLERHALQDVAVAVVGMDVLDAQHGC